MSTASNISGKDDAVHRHPHQNGYSGDADLERTQTVPHRPYGGTLQPGTYSETKFRKIANPAPLGLCGFALTTFVLSLVNVECRGLNVPNIVLGLAFGYGGLVQLLAGMWEFVCGNTFGATAFASYGGFWISYAMIISGGGQSYGVVPAYEAEGVPVNALQNALGFYLAGWFIFTTIMLLATLRSTLMFFLLFFFLDITFMLLAIGHLYPNDGTEAINVIKAGGVFGLITAFIAWYNALAGLLEKENSFFTIPAIYFPWSSGNPKRIKSQKAEV